MPAPASKRNHQRFDTTLSAFISMKFNPSHELPCSLADLSITGACLHLETSTAVKSGAVINIRIPIPDTLLTINGECEIMWVKTAGDGTRLGIRFMDSISRTMLSHIIKT